MTSDLSSESIKPGNLFKCLKCGDCCKGFGGTFVTEQDIKLIADFINMEPGRFLRECCELSEKKPVLARGKDGYCMFWDELCLIHPVKPRMCRAWPFIEGVLADFNNWRIMAGVCPGIRIDGPDELIIECTKKKLSKL